MRISDWSSDVCSSDLIRLRGGDPPAQQLGFVAALALHRALSAWAPAARLSLKWPNDLLMDGAKLSGILLEREGDAVIAGFGVNLAHHPKDVEQIGRASGRERVCQYV